MTIQRIITKFGMEVYHTHASGSKELDLTPLRLSAYYNKKKKQEQGLQLLLQQ